MSAHTLESIQKNVSDVFRAQLTGGNSFLDQELNVTTDQSQRAKLETIIRYMQKQNWNMADEGNCKLEKGIRLGLRTIYQDDPLSELCTFRLVHKSTDDYGGMVQKQLSTLLDLRLRLTMLSMHAGMVNGQRYFEAVRQFENELQSSLSEVSSNPENQRLAFQCLFLTEGIKRTASALSEGMFSKIDSSMKEVLSTFDITNPSLNKFRKAFFPSIQNYIDGIAQDSSKEGSALNKYEGKCRILGRIEEENKKSESIYRFLMNEMKRIKDSYKGKEKNRFSSKILF